MYNKTKGALSIFQSCIFRDFKTKFRNVEFHPQLFDGHVSACKKRKTMKLNLNLNRFHKG